MFSEKLIEQKIMLSLSKKGCKVFKNSNGMAYTKDGTPFRHGFGDGSSDIIACVPTIITKDMVGKTIGIFTAIEVKKNRTGYKATDKQKAFINAISSCGGNAGVAYDIDTANEIAYKE